MFRIVRSIILSVFLVVMGLLLFKDRQPQIAAWLFPGDVDINSLAHANKPVSVVAPTVTVTPSPTPKTVLDLTPNMLSIPKLGIHAQIEPVGVTANRNMDTPKHAENASWYKYGVKPSERGNAVIAAHFDTPSGKPALFYNLRTLEIGDELSVTATNGVVSEFVVTGKSFEPYSTFPSDYVFNTKEGRNVNLITCDGVFDRATKLYSRRLVVYTTMKGTF